MRNGDWHERRRSFVGASEVAAILGLSPYGSAFDVWAVKTGLVPPFEGNDATRLGQTLESSILDHAERQVGDLRRDVEIESPERCGVIRATLDGINDESGHVVEAKTAGLLSGTAANWGDEGKVEHAEQVPKNYWIQIQIQLMVADQEHGSIFALLPRRGICRFDVEIDRVVCGMMVERVNDWWQRHIIEGNEPEMFGASIDVLKQIPRDEPEIHFDESVQRLVDEYRSVQVEEKRFRKRRESIQAELVQHLGKSESGGLPDGSKITFKQQTRKAFSVAESTTRVFRVSKAKG